MAKAIPDSISGSPPISQEGHPRRWAILAVLNLSLVLIVASVSSLNIAIPAIQRELNATAAELVWINASYALVFAGVLLPAGAIGDRFGRRGALLVGLVVFIAASLVSTFSSDPMELIILRGLMGVGAGLIMPATLSIVTVIFPPEERSKAIAIWSGFAGAGGAIGTVASGFLLNFFWWGSIFLVNVPIAAVTAILVILMVPTSRDEGERPLDPAGSFLSFGGLIALVYGLVQGPEFGWNSWEVIAAFVISIVLLTAWVRVELAHRNPLLDPRLFRLRRFSMGSFGVTSAFLVMFGFFFIMTQYLQFVLDYSALGAAVRTLPFAVTMVLIAPSGPIVSARFGQGRTIASGMVIAALGCAWFQVLGADSSYVMLLPAIMVTAGGMALAFPAMTEAIVTSVPPDKAGVGSAMNDTTREVGGAVGIALLGVLLSVGYRLGLGSATDGLPAEAAEAAEDNIGAALAVANEFPGVEGLADAARDAFVDGMQLAMGVGAGIMFASAMVIARLFPRNGTTTPQQ